MRKSKNYSIKLALFYIASNIVFGAYVPESDAIKVAQKIYVERANLYNGDGFSISYIETITNEGKKLIYIFHLDSKGFIMVPAIAIIP